MGKVEAGLTQEQLDELVRTSKEFHSDESMALTNESQKIHDVNNDERFDGMLLEKEAALENGQRRSPYRKASTGSTKCPSLEASSDEKGDSQEEDSQEEEEDSAYVKKKKERA